MRKLTPIIAILGILIPTLGAAQAYLTPEDVLKTNDSAFLQPGRVRGAQWASDLQAQQMRERHPSIISEPWDPKQDMGIPPPEPSLVTGNDAVIPGSSTQGLDDLTIRLLERLTRENVIRSGYLPSTAGAYGYPLVGSGPESIVMASAMVMAGLWTIRRARLLQRFVRGM